ncbi:hypothetical protein [Desulfovibrio inopinatus]|uniref:hypothetical protein n=1 Tax=Desulfovibrio inopinatus TaxID=102109 RepID=UPI000421DA77|nr:hypothetical protein [Desulfovibrio inopinatus]
MQKNVWITVLEKDEARGKKLFETVSRYAVVPNGHFWVDDLEKMAWAGVADSLTDSNTALWIIAGKAESFASPTISRGLSLLAAKVLGQRGYGFPIILVPTEGELTVDSLPTPLRGTEVVTAASLGVKVAALANMPIKPVATEYNFQVYPIPGVGLWLEVGPSKGHSWNGAMLGVVDAEIRAHGVGPSGTIPQRTVIEYQMQGLKIQAGETEFTAWALKNTLSENDSYYVSLQGTPSELLFGEFSESDEAEVYRVRFEANKT